MEGRILYSIKSIIQKKYDIIGFLIIPFIILIWFSPPLTLYLTDPSTGFQLAMGRLILLGEFPAVDYFTGTNLMPGFISALGISSTHSLIGEILICSGGYAFSIYLIHKISEKYICWFAGIIVPVITFLFLARFYKWYYWLFPLLILYLLLQYHEDRKKATIFAIGFFTSIGGLFRVDFFGAFLIFFILTFFWITKKESVPRNDFLIYIGGLLLPVGSWIMMLILHQGTVLFWIRSAIAASTSVINSWGHSIPFLQPTSPFWSYSNVGPLSLFILFTYLIGFAISTFVYFFRWNIQKKFYPLFFTSLMGLLIYPIFYMLAELQHLLQVIPPFLIVSSMLIHTLIHCPTRKKSVHISLSTFCVVYSAILIIIILGLSSSSGFLSIGVGGFDYSSIHSDPINKFAQLPQLPLDLSSSNKLPNSELVRFIKNNTNTSDNVLIIPWELSHLYFFFERKMSGMVIWYGGAYSDNNSRIYNLNKVEENPPKYIIVTDKVDYGDITGDPKKSIKETYPELYQYISQYYINTTYSYKGYKVLSL